MRATLIIVLSLILWAPGSAWAQTPAPALPSAKLSPYEEQRYGDTLWAVPREPYQSGYRMEEYKARPYARPGLSQRRFHNEMTWRNEQRKISERSRQPVAAPLKIK